ncbi:hypothetical protein PhCBS80983_g04449 [Powellomyces hirtus]|uniref:Ubiquitin-conjugating enzyme E2 1 n=1 Tax=Powellomyces hirtus TaxID=109895 RepID=A0A507DYY5_9FUNG|nr:hypothetical protein PhCBS80983_g04449 [Powellomyces hirtus]
MLMDTRRIEREIRQVHSDKSANLTIEPIDDNLSHLRGTIRGPPHSAYSGGVFHLDIHIPQTYPFVPPLVKFVTRVYHPNVSSVTGAICLDILKDEWTPVLTLKTVMISLQSLLCDPVPDNPQDAEVAAHYKRSRTSFETTARQWTEMYACSNTTTTTTSSTPPDPAPPPPPPPSPPAASASEKALVDMGFPLTLVRRALVQSDGSETRALEALLADNVL